VQRLAGQLEIDDPSCVKQYAERLPTQHEHAREITEVYGYRKFDTEEVQREFRGFVAARAWTTTEGPRTLFDRSAAWLIRHKVLLPGVTTLAKRVAEIREEQATRLYGAVTGLVSTEQAGMLEGLLRVDDGARTSTLERLRTGPRHSTPTELSRQVDRLSELRSFGLAEVDVPGIPPNRLSWLARYGIGSKTATIRGLAQERRTATLVAMLRVLTQAATDDTMDVFDALVRENLLRRAERESQKTRLKALPELSRARSLSPLA
jgi:Transposase.